MSKDIRIKKGLTYFIKRGEAEMRTENAKDSKTFKVRLDDFHGLTPKLIHKETLKFLKVNLFSTRTMKKYFSFHQ